MALEIALAAPSTSTASASNGDRWVSSEKSFPEDVGKLVGSGVGVFFFVKIVSASCFEKIMTLPIVTTWNPFTDEHKSLPPTPWITEFPWFVRVQPLQRGDYTFTMIGRTYNGDSAEEVYSSITKSWRFVHSRHKYARYVFAVGLDPPGSPYTYLNVNNEVDGLLKVTNDSHAITLSRPLDPALHRYAELDELHCYVFLLPRNGPRFVLQGQRHDGKNTHAILFTSPEIELHRAETHETFVFAAKSVVQVTLLENFWSNDIMHLYLIESREWRVLSQGPRPILFCRAQLRSAFICESAEAISEASSVVAISGGAAKSSGGAAAKSLVMFVLK